MKKKAIAYVTASDDVAYYFAERVKKSFEHFHPDLECRIITIYDGKDIFGEIKEPTFGSVWAALSVKLINYYLKDYEIVIKLDADVVITHRLDEFLDEDYDIAGSLNVRGYSEKFDDYCNLGLTAIKSDKFAQEWEKLTYDDNFIGDMGYSNLEQDVMNHLAHSGKYKFLIVDKEGCYYNETSKEFWHEMFVREEKLMIGSRIVKGMHWAGGGTMSNKYSYPSFRPEVRNFLNKVTDTEDFTDEQC